MNLLARLDHERILYFHDAFEKKNVVIIVTEICHEEMLDRFAKKSIIMESDPDNILMGDAHSDQIRLCDFGNALEVTPGEAQYCKYGTPEFVSAEIVNQSPVSKSTDICLTGVSPFAGENDRSSVLNIRNYNAAEGDGVSLQQHVVPQFNVEQWSKV
ncbi:hypothetical protein CRUP_000350 [Coryphaenoides rupestris]|nr:hypothetical protein CRUP_000350 [Coryphaenoides rupestris]